MYCMKCGKEIDDTAKYCVECGHKVGEKLNKAEPVISGKQVYKAIENSKNVGNGMLKQIKEKIKLPLDEIISLVIMVIAIILCLLTWFDLPGMGEYSPVQWKNFMNMVGYNVGDKAFERANKIPGMFIWMDMPLVFYALNVISIIKNKCSVVAYEIIGILFSIGIFVYAKAYFAFYDSYALGGYMHCSMGAAFYIMFVIVMIDILRREKSSKKQM